MRVRRARRARVGGAGAWDAGRWGGACGATRACVCSACAAAAAAAAHRSHAAVDGHATVRDVAAEEEGRPYGRREHSVGLTAWILADIAVARPEAGAAARKVGRGRGQWNEHGEREVVLVRAKVACKRATSNEDRLRLICDGLRA
jgi:hypothetical protein